MNTLSFILSPEAVIRLHDAVLCLAKFSEIVSLEAREDKVGLSTTNHTSNKSVLMKSAP